MIRKEELKTFINEVVEKNKLHLIDLIVGKTNKINVYIDGINGVTISDCEKLSRAIEHHLNRDEEDFELEVSSPGLDSPLKMPFQYKKNTGRQLQVILNDGDQITGTVVQADDKSVELEYSIKEKQEGTAKKQRIVKKHILEYKNIKTAKVIVKF